MWKTGFVVILAMSALPATGQTIVSRGSGLAHDCFIIAKTGRDPRGGIDTCGLALREEMLTIKDRAATYDNRGVMLDQLGQDAAALEDFNAAIRLNPQLGDSYVNLGSMLIKQKRLDDALVQIDKGLALGMSFPHIGYYDRAVAEQLMGRYREAYYDYKKVLELEPDFTQASERLKDFTVVRKPSSG